jgi:aminocarboxymuconate-semialdehyde decarboxylase
MKLSPVEAIHRLYTDTVCNWPPALELALRVFGEDRVLFGTDEPFWAPSKTYDTLAKLDLSDETARKINTGNAERLFGIPPVS